MNNLYVRLAKNNLKNNKSLYVPYMVAGMITVLMFYIMMFINNSAGLEKMRGAYYITTIMSFGVIVVGVFSYIYIFYTNSFISKRRKKEMGIYNILGMEKRHIAKVLAIENLKIAAQSYNEVGSLAELEHKIAVKTEAGKSAKQSVVELEHRIKDLAEIIKYAQQYKDNRSYHIGYKKAKNPDAYFRRYESQIILYGGARRMLEQAGINLKGLNVDKLKAEYQELMKQKSELTSTYKKCEKEVQSLNRKLENLNQYLGQTHAVFQFKRSHLELLRRREEIVSAPTESV